jgi:hypothetical protein
MTVYRLSINAWFVEETHAAVVHHEHLGDLQQAAADSGSGEGRT